MKILGVDPGTLRTGAGVIEAQGNQYRLVYQHVFKPNPKDSVPRRLLGIYRYLCEVIETHRPDVLVLENIFYGKDLHATLKIGEARACAMLAASAEGLDIIEYAPARIKLAVAGNGRASKEQVQQMIRSLLNLKELPPADSADALAAAICHIHAYANRAVMNQLREYAKN